MADPASVASVIAADRYGRQLYDVACGASSLSIKKFASSSDSSREAGCAAFWVYASVSGIRNRKFVLRIGNDFRGGLTLNEVRTRVLGGLRDASEKLIIDQDGYELEGKFDPADFSTQCKISLQFIDSTIRLAALGHAGVDVVKAVGTVDGGEEDRRGRTRDHRQKEVDGECRRIWK